MVINIGNAHFTRKQHGHCRLESPTIETRKTRIWDMACHVTRVLGKTLELLDTGGINGTCFFLPGDEL